VSPGLLGATLLVGIHGATVQEVVDRAEPGDVVVLPEGRWSGPVRIDKSLTLTGEGTLAADGAGRTLTISAPGVTVKELTVTGSGDDLAVPDACIYLEPSAQGAVIEGCHLDDCLFGIWVHETDDIKVVGNVVVGRPEAARARKGNGIHLFDATRATVLGNVVSGARDGIYVSVTEDSLIAENTASNQRFGIHYMYSYDNVIRDNVTNHNSGGVALMQSRRLTVTGNQASHNERHGILFRDLQDSEVAYNRVEGNAEGFFFFSSLDNQFHHNTILGNQIGARIWAGTERNEVWGNAFVGNRQQVYYVSAYDQTWGTDEGGNYWSDHLAWDQDRDGVADRPYRADVATARMLQRYPSSVLLLSSPTLELIRTVQRRIPSLRVPSVLDPEPLVMRPGEAP